MWLHAAVSTPSVGAAGLTKGIGVKDPKGAPASVGLRKQLS